MPLAWGGNLEVSPAVALDRAPAPEEFPFVVMTRLLSFRNFSGFPFAVSASPKTCEAVADKALSLFAKRRDHSIWRLSDCPPHVLRLLRERHLLPSRSLPFPGKKGSKYLAVAPGAKSWALVNEVEHLTFGQVFPGRLAAAEFASAYLLPPEEPSDETAKERSEDSPEAKSLKVLPSKEILSRPVGGDQRLPWSWSRTLGYLSSNPERIGPALEIEMLVHLPGLALARKLPQARNAMSALGVASSPVSALENGEAEAGLFLLKSRGGSGKSAHRVYTEFLGSVQPLLEWERSLQRRCLEKHHKRLEDRVQDSLRRLARAAVLSYPELLALSSYLRLGAYLALLPAQITAIAEELRVVAGSGHLGVSSGRTESGCILAKEEEDIRRANVVRLALETLHV